MSTILAISPHLDDAIFSAGAWLARKAKAGARVVIVTCFTGNVARPDGFALACQLDKGLGPEMDYMALRRAEDREACAIIGAEPVHLPFLEAPHRGYDSPAALFGAPLAEAGLEHALRAALTALLVSHAPVRLLAPAAIGNHVDHRLVRRVVQRLPEAATSWADFPYAARQGFVPNAFEAVACGDAWSDKRAACLCYRSQLRVQFGHQGVVDHLIAIDGCEWFSGPTDVAVSNPDKADSA